MEKLETLMEINVEIKVNGKVNIEFTVALLLLTNLSIYEFIHPTYK